MRLATAKTLALALVAVVMAGCGGGHKAAAPPPECRLTPAQHRDIAAANREIVLMRRLEQPLKTVHESGPPALEHAVNRFLLDVGPLPPDVKGDLLHKAKSATGLCHDCFEALGSEEPVVSKRVGGNPCRS